MNLKKLISAAAASALSISALASAEFADFIRVLASAPEVTMCPITMLGDADDSGALGVADLGRLGGYALGSGADIHINADINLDGSINALDKLALKRMLIGSYHPADFTRLVINEVCSSNGGCYVSSADKKPDWIELYNASGAALDVSGFGVSDGSSNLFKFVFPEGTIIPANGYVMILCDDSSDEFSNNEYHAPFKISASGETLYLTHPTAGTTEVCVLPDIATDVTYGRYANGSENFAYLMPSPVESNDYASVITNVPMPLFDVESGFYASAFNLSLSSALGYTVYYTTDGSDPRTSSTARAYSSSININDKSSEANVYSAKTGISLTGYTAPNSKVDKATVVRAVARDSSGTYSAIATETYFIGYDPASEYYDNMTVVSLTTDPANLFDSQEGIYVIGDQYYQWRSSSQYDSSIEPGDDANPTNYNSRGREWEREATMQIFENGEYVLSQNVGIRTHGAWSRAFAQKSFNIYSRGEYGKSKIDYMLFDGLTAEDDGSIIDKFDSLSLRNGGNDFNSVHLRDDLIQSLVSDRAIATQATKPCIVFIDGEFWGLYSMIEKYNDYYVQQHYGVDKSNVTILKNGELEEGDQTVIDSYRDFFNWAVNADMSNSSNYQRFCNTIDMQSFMDYIAVQTYIGNYDWSNASYVNNWQMWRANTVDATNTYADGKWRFMLFDTEYSSGLYTNYSIDIINNLNTTKNYAYNIGALFKSVLANAGFKTAFYNNYLEIANNNLSSAAVNQRLDELTAVYKQPTLDTYTRFFANQASVKISAYDNNINVIKTFYQKRNLFAIYYLEIALGMKTIGSDGNMLGHPGGWTIMSTDRGSIDVDMNNNVSITTTSTGSNNWDQQLGYVPVELISGKSYTVTFKARSNVNQRIDYGFQLNASPYTWYCGQTINLNTNDQTFTYTFTANTSTTNAKFYLNAGYSVGTIYLSDVRMTRNN